MGQNRRPQCRSMSYLSTDLCQGVKNTQSRKTVSSTNNTGERGHPHAESKIRSYAHYTQVSKNRVKRQDVKLSTATPAVRDAKAVRTTPNRTAAALNSQGVDSS